MQRLPTTACLMQRFLSIRPKLNRKVWVQKGEKMKTDTDELRGCLKMQSPFKNLVKHQQGFSFPHCRLLRSLCPVFSLGCLQITQLIKGTLIRVSSLFQLLSLLLLASTHSGSLLVSDSRQNHSPAQLWA